MKIYIGNCEPDGRMLVEAEDHIHLFIVHTDAIDNLADAIKAHAGSEGDGYPFSIDLFTGKVELL